MIDPTSPEAYSWEPPADRAIQDFEVPLAERLLPAGGTE